MKKLILFLLMTILGVESSFANSLYCNESNYKGYVFNLEKTLALLVTTNNGCDLLGVTLKKPDPLYLTDSDLRWANLKGINLNNTDLEGAKYNESTLFPHGFDPESKDMVLWTEFPTNGNDDLYGTKGNDTLIGKKGNDTLVGFSGEDLLKGGNGHDRLVGGPGNDELRGWNGWDLFFGGPGNDRFVFSIWESGHNSILDFSQGDLIVLKKHLAADPLWPYIPDILASQVMKINHRNNIIYIYTLKPGLTVELETNEPLTDRNFVVE